MAAQLVLLGFASSVLAALLSGSLGGTIDGASVVATALLLSGTWIAARVVVGIDDRRHPARTLVLGTGSTARQVWGLSMRHRECAFEVVGFLDDEPLDLPPGAPATLGQLTELPRLVAEHEIELVIVAYTTAGDADVVAILRTLQGVRIQVIPRLYELVQARGFELGRITVLDAGGLPPCIGEHSTKRAIDVLAASTLLMLLSPLLLAIAIAIKLEDGGPIFFLQRRVGKHGQVFGMLKFRTMSQGAEQRGYDMIEGLPIEDAVRELKTCSAEMHATRVGRRLRRHSLDELPQFWNVICGRYGARGATTNARIRGFGPASVASERAAFGATGHHRPLAGVRVRLDELAGADRARLDVCAPLVDDGRPADPRPHDRRCHASRQRRMNAAQPRALVICPVVPSPPVSEGRSARCAS